MVIAVMAWGSLPAHAAPLKKRRIAVLAVLPLLHHALPPLHLFLFVSDQTPQLHSLVDDLAKLLATLRPRLGVLLALALQLGNLGIEFFQVRVLVFSRAKEAVTCDLLRQVVVLLTPASSALPPAAIAARRCFRARLARSLQS